MNFRRNGEVFAIPTVLVLLVLSEFAPLVLASGKILGWTGKYRNSETRDTARQYPLREWFGSCEEHVAITSDEVLLENLWALASNSSKPGILVERCIEVK